MVAELARCSPELAPGSGAGAEERVRAALEAQDAAAGWDPDSGAVHPTGGYTQRTLTARTFPEAVVMVVYRDAAGVEHRVDGPAMAHYGADGKPNAAYWFEGGQGHRVDGPARLERATKRVLAHARSYVDGHSVYHGAGREGRQGAQRFADLVAAGRSPSEAVSWMGVEQALGADESARGAVEEMVAAGCDASLAHQAAHAAVLDVEAIAAVARGELPLSWAVAGAWGVRGMPVRPHHTFHICARVKW